MRHKASHNQVQIDKRHLIVWCFRKFCDDTCKKDYTEFLALSFAASSSVGHSRPEDEGGSSCVEAISQSENTIPHDSLAAQPKPTAGLKFSVPSSWVEETKSSINQTQEDQQRLSMPLPDTKHKEEDAPRKVCHYPESLFILKFPFAAQRYTQFWHEI